MVPVVEGLPLKVEMMNVIPCATFEQAATFERLFGDGKLKARRKKNAQKNPASALQFSRTAPPTSGSRARRGGRH